MKKNFLALAAIVATIFTATPVLAQPLSGEDLFGGNAQTFVTETSGLASTDVSHTVAAIIRTLLGFLGILCVLAIIVGVPIGIVLLVRTPRIPRKKHVELPLHLDKWNWGAAGLPWIWGSCYGVWIGLLSFIPLLNWVWWIVMGIKGNEWAWQKIEWKDEEEFIRTQNKWKPWGIAAFAIHVFFWGIYILATLADSSY